MYILGISGQQRDAAAALVKDGRLVAAIEEEKLSRVKRIGIDDSGGLPFKSIEACFTTEGITWQDIDHVAYYEKPKRLGTDIYSRVRKFFDDPTTLAYSTNGLNTPQAFIRTRELIRHLNPRTKITNVAHHLSHAASAFYPAPFDQAAILTVDCLGDSTTMQFAMGQGKRIRVLRALKFPDSLGFLYSLITNHLGFVPYRDEHKTECLAPLGEPEFYENFRKLVQVDRDGLFKLDASYFNSSKETGFVSEKFYKAFGPPRGKDDALGKKHYNLARSLQAVVEEVLLDAVGWLHKQTKLDYLCLAGGLFYNLALNSRLAHDTPFRKVFIQPASGNAGGSLGSALYLWRHVLGQPRAFTMEHVYYGPEFESEDIKKVLDNCKVSYEYLYEGRLLKKTADLLAKGHVVGWFQGRAEWGPRALGNRSILADPTRVLMKENLNEYVKHRESFRPFAPAILEEYVPSYFDLKDPSPFMLTLETLKEEKRSFFPSIGRIDGRTKVQTVSRKTNPIFWELLNHFYELTGVPLLINTSFNAMGEPLICTPRDAVKTFFSTGIDYLAMGNFLVRK
jgi:carbamoyltransferase